MGTMRDAAPAVVEPAIIQTRYISGILTPEFDGECWVLTLYEDRSGERVIVDRFAMSQPNFMAAVTVAVAPVAVALGIAVPQVRAH